MRLRSLMCAGLILTIAGLLPGEDNANRAFAGTKPRPEMLVSTAWLNKNLDRESLVLLHVGDRAEYAAEHLPGAQLIELSDVSLPRGEGLMLEFPALEQLKAAFERLGVSDDSRIVIYWGKDSITQTARIYLTLDYLGMGRRTSLLDGGLPAWRAAGGTLTSEVKRINAGKFNPRPRKDVVVDVAWVKDNLRKPAVLILDARAPRFYDGTDPGRMSRAGHIPGAVNVPYTDILDQNSGKFKDKTILRRVFQEAGAARAQTIVNYCHIGQQASLLYFAGRYLGYDVRLYDGSFQDWSGRKELPVEGGKAIRSPQ